MAPSPQVPPVVGPAVTVALEQLKFPAAALLLLAAAAAALSAAVAAAAAALSAAVAAAAGTVAGIVVNCVTWPTDLLVAQGARAQ